MPSMTRRRGPHPRGGRPGGSQPSSRDLLLVARESLRGHERCAEAETPARVGVDDGERPAGGLTERISADPPPSKAPISTTFEAPSAAAAITPASAGV